MKRYLRNGTFLLMLIALLVPVSALAKGNFAFITIKGGGLSKEIRSSDPALTEDFLAYTDFINNKAVAAPVNPGAGYLITRYYIDNTREQAFDRLHYYPEDGLVYYDGIYNGWSDYDGKWYIARPEIKSAFENALPHQTLSAMPFIAIAEMAFVMVLAFLIRQHSTN